MEFEVKKKWFLIFFSLTSIQYVACGSDMHVDEHHYQVDLRFLTLEELNEKLSRIKSEDDFDVQIDASVKKLESKGYFLVQILETNNFKILSKNEYQEIVNMQISKDGTQLGCQKDSDKCLYRIVKGYSLESYLKEEG